MRKHPFLYWISVLSFCILTALFPAAKSFSQASAVYARQFTTEDGLSQNFVYCALQDSRGLMWFGTRDGLNKFDGYTFTHYKFEPFSKNSLTGNVIKALCEDTLNKILWVGTHDGGLSRLDLRTGLITSYQHKSNDPTSLSSNDITSLLLDHTNTLWVGTFGGGLNRFDPLKRSFTRYSYSNNPYGLPSDAIISLFEDNNGIMWVGTSTGIARVDLKNNKGMRAPSIAPSILRLTKTPYIQRIYGSNTRAVYVIACLHLLVYDSLTDSLKPLVSTTIPGLYAIQEAGDHLWIGSVSGLYQYSFKSGKLHPATSFLSNPAVLSQTEIISLYVDPQQGLWIGSQNGLFYIRKESSKLSFKNYEPDNYTRFADNNIRSLYEDKEENLWLGLGNGKLKQLKNATLTTVNLGIRLRNPINTIYEDHNKQLWLGTTNDGLICFNPATKTAKRFSSNGRDTTSLAGLHIWAVHEDHNHNLWVGTLGDGASHYGTLNRFDPIKKTFEHPLLHYQMEGVLPNNLAVWSICEDHRGILWLGTSAGLIAFDPQRETFERFSYDPNDQQGISHSEVWSVFEDSRSTLWVGTWGGGLNWFDRQTKTFHHYMRTEGFPNNVIYSIQEYHSTLYVSTGKDIIVIDLNSGKTKNYNVTDGLGNEFNPNSSARTKQGNIYFGGTKGLICISAEVDNDNSAAPPILITKLKKYDLVLLQDVLDSTSIDLSYSDKFFSFEFAALDYINPSKNQYAYRLIGFDTNWNYCENRRYATYTNLDPGEYILQVIGSNSDGVWNRQGVKVRIKVQPPFWATAPFYLFSVLTISGSVMVYGRKRQQRREQYNRALDIARENERRMIATDIHDGPLQDLYSSRFLLEPILDSAITDKDSFDKLEQLNNILKKTRSSLRDVCGVLQPLDQYYSLEEIIERHIDIVRKAYPALAIQCDLAKASALTPEISTNLFRIYRTSMNNVLKHSEATEVFVTLLLTDKVMLEVRDNGKGFTPPKNKKNLLADGHLGLLLAQSCAEACNGTLEILSGPNTGTVVRCRAGLKNDQSQWRRIIKWYSPHSYLKKETKQWTESVL